MLKKLSQSFRMRIITALSIVTLLLIIALIMWGWRMGAMSILPVDLYYC